MNVMLISVTRPDGDRSPAGAGAQQGDIQSQFIMEALVLCLVGGVIGIVLESSSLHFCEGFPLGIPDLVRIHYSWLRRGRGGGCFFRLLSGTFAASWTYQGLAFLIAGSTFFSPSARPGTSRSVSGVPGRAVLASGKKTTGESPVPQMRREAIVPDFNGIVRGPLWTAGSRVSPAAADLRNSFTCGGLTAAE